MDKSINIGLAACIISIAAGSAVQIAVGVEMITQTNAVYFLIGAGILFLVGVGFLVHGIRFKPKTTRSFSIVNPQSGGNLKTTNPLTHKLIHSLICEIVGVGSIIGGAFLTTQNSSNPMSFFIGFFMVVLGFGIFSIGVGIGVSK